MRRQVARPMWRPTASDALRALAAGTLAALAVLAVGCDAAPDVDSVATPVALATSPLSTGPAPVDPPGGVELLPVALASDPALPAGLPEVLLLPADYEILAASEVGDSALLVIDAGPGGMAVFAANSAALVARGWVPDREVLTEDVRTLVAVKGGTQVSLSAIAGDGVRLTYQVQPAP